MVHDYGIGFGHAYVSRWRDGNAPRTKGASVVVSHDTHHLAYDIDADDMPAFTEWVADNWQNDFRWREDDESASDYLERIDVRIWGP